MTIQDFEDDTMTVDDFAAQLERIKTGPLPAQVEVDELGNTIPADQYRREQADHLATRINRIAWNSGALERARKVASEARIFAGRVE